MTSLASMLNYHQTDIIGFDATRKSGKSLQNQAKLMRNIYAEK